MSEHPHDDPEHPGNPPGDPGHPDHPHGTPPGQDPNHPDTPEHPDHEPHPEHPITEPDEEPHPEPQASDAQPHAAAAQAPVEPALGFRDFLAVKPMRVAASAAMRRWMKVHGHDPDGHYPLPQWQDYHQRMLTSV